MRGLEDIELEQVGLEAVFECEVTKADIKPQWLKADKALRKSDKVEISSKNGIHRLVVKEANGDDVGDYTIKLDKLVSKAKLTIKGQ